MEFRQTKHQVARGTRPDYESYGKLGLIKAASELRSTYQIRLLLYRALREGKKLEIVIRADCKFRADLLSLVADHKHVLKILRELKA